MAGRIEEEIAVAFPLAADGVDAINQGLVIAEGSDRDADYHVEMAIHHLFEQGDDTLLPQAMDALRLKALTRPSLDTAAGYSVWGKDDLYESLDQPELSRFVYELAAQHIAGVAEAEGYETTAALAETFNEVAGRAEECASFDVFEALAGRIGEQIVDSSELVLAKDADSGFIDPMNFYPLHLVVRANKDTNFALAERANNLIPEGEYFRHELVAPDVEIDPTPDPSVYELPPDEFAALLALSNREREERGYDREKWDAKKALSEGEAVLLERVQLLGEEGVAVAQTAVDNLRNANPNYFRPSDRSRTELFSYRFSKTMCRAIAASGDQDAMRDLVSDGQTADSAGFQLVALADELGTRNDEASFNAMIEAADGLSDGFIASLSAYFTQARERVN